VVISNADSIGYHFSHLSSNAGKIHVPQKKQPLFRCLNMSFLIG